MGFLAGFFGHWKGVLPPESCDKRGFKAELNRQAKRSLPRTPAEMKKG
jgi:hypothetical protein